MNTYEEATRREGTGLRGLRDGGLRSERPQADKVILKLCIYAFCFVSSVLYINQVSVNLSAV